MTLNPHEMPAEAFIVDATGAPIAHMNFDRISTDATLLMYELAATAGDDEATDRVSTEWVTRLGPATFGYVAAAALSLTVRNILGPTLDVCAAVGADLRPGLKSAAADARRDLGAGS